MVFIMSKWAKCNITSKNYGDFSYVRKNSGIISARISIENESLKWKKGVISKDYIWNIIFGQKILAWVVFGIQVNAKSLVQKFFFEDSITWVFWLIPGK